MPATGHGVSVNLRLNIDDRFSVGLQPGNVNFNVEVTDALKYSVNGMLQNIKDNLLANNGVLGHNLKVLASDNVPVAGGSDKNVGFRSSFLHGDNFITGHSSLQSIDGVNFSDQDTGAVASQ